MRRQLTRMREEINLTRPQVDHDAGMVAEHDTTIAEDGDALVELAEMLTEQADALVELAQMIEGGN